MDNKEVKLNSSNIRLISLSPSNIDDLFIYKHKIEEDIAKASEQPIERMSLDEFINKYLNISSHSYFYSKTQETVAYSLVKAGDTYACFYAVNNEDDAFKSFIDTMDEIEWTPEKLPVIKAVDVYDKMDNINFFVIDGKMRAKLND